jgi:hypothetical protein
VKKALCLAFLAAAGCVIATPARAEKECDVSRQPGHVYQIRMMPLSQVVTPSHRTVTDSQGIRVTIDTRGDEWTHKVKPKRRAPCMDSMEYSVVVKASEFSKAKRPDGTVSISIVPSFKPSGLSEERACLDVPVKNFRTAKERGGRMQVFFRPDENVAMRWKRLQYLAIFDRHNNNNNIDCYTISTNPPRKPIKEMRPESLIS